MKSLNVKIEAIKPERKYYTETSHFDSLEPTQKLDAVLSGLSIYGKYIPDIHQHLQIPTITSTTYEVQLIINKLIRDNNAEEIKVQMHYDGPPQFEPPGGTWNIFYKISFEGSLLITNGGYTQLAINDAYENTRLEKLEKKQKENQIFLTWLTVVLAFGALVETIYYLVDLYWEHGWFH